jgi:hypothetical protein
MGPCNSKSAADGGGETRVAPGDAAPADHKVEIKKRYTRMSQIAKPKKDTGPETHMSKAEVRALWPDADEQIFNSAYKIFDWTAHSEDEKADNVKMFTILMVSLLAPDEAQRSPTHLYEVAFLIFDVDESGALDKEEFGKMISVIYKSKANALRLVFDTKAGHDMLESFASKEHCAENIAFLDAVTAWAAKAAAGDASAAEAAHVHDTYCTEIAPYPVNLSARTKKLLDEGLAKDPPPPDLFDKARKDILKLIEQDTFARFNKDKDRLDELVKKLFVEVDKSHTGKIERDEYVDWAKNNPEVTQFYQPLTKLTEDVKKRRAAADADAKPADPA